MVKVIDNRDKPKRGGAREGAGRKPKAGKGVSLRIVGLRVDVDTYDILKDEPDKTGYIMRAVKYYHKKGEPE